MPGSPADDLKTRPVAAVTFLSFNIRVLLPGDPPWTLRRAGVVDVIRTADVAMLQEASEEQLSDLTEILPAYAVAGTSPARRGGEACPVLYKRDRFRSVGGGQFWLSRHPEQPDSIGWDAMLSRVCSWVELIDDELRFFVFSTHFDHRGRRARRRSGRLVGERVRRLDAPAVVGMDANAGPRTRPMRTMAKAGLRDTLGGADVPTYHAFGRRRRGPRLDYVLATPHWKVVQAAVVHTPPHVSDHYPVRAVLTAS